MDEVRQRPVQGDSPQSAFDLLEQETQELTQEPTGVGLDVPAWLLSLEQEVDVQLRDARFSERPDTSRLPLPQAGLTAVEVTQQLTLWELHPH